MMDFSETTMFSTRLPDPESSEALRAMCNSVAYSPAMVSRFRDVSSRTWSTTPSGPTRMSACMSVTLSRSFARTSRNFALMKSSTRCRLPLLRLLTWGGIGRCKYADGIQRLDSRSNEEDQLRRTLYRVRLFEKIPDHRKTAQARNLTNVEGIRID